MCQTRIGRLSTRAARSAAPSGDHHMPRYRSISSAATNSATPHDDVGIVVAGEPAVAAGRDVTRRSPSAT